MMRPVDGHKGCFEYTTRITGLEGHGSAPDLGVSAIEFATRIAQRLYDLRDALKTCAPENGPFDPPHSTLNIGLLSGGAAHNIIPGSARIEWEMRPVRASDADRVKTELASFCAALVAEMRRVHPGADITTETIAEVVGLDPVADSPASRLVMDLTGANRPSLVSFGTEAGLFQQIGIPSVICGPGDIAQAHKPDEFLSVEQLSACLGMLHRLADRLGDAP
jgi:acetylornithine deacetylase